MSDSAAYSKPLVPPRSQGEAAPRGVDWDHYDLDLSPSRAARKPCSASPAPIVRSPAMRVAGRHYRLAAKLLDHVLLAGFYLTSSAVIEALNASDHVKPVLVLLILLVLPICQGILLALRGQTLGKLMMGIRIVSAEDDANPGLWRVVAVRGVLPQIISLFPLLGQMFLLADVLWIFSKEKRCLHDLMADTKVVEA